MKKTTVSFTIVGCTFIWLASCGEKQDPLLTGDGSIAISPTYCDEIKPILDNHCIRCHASNLSGAERLGAPASVNFETYQQAIQSAIRANARIQDGSMPPGGGIPLPQRETFDAWVEADTPEGCEADGTT